MSENQWQQLDKSDPDTASTDTSAGAAAKTQANDAGRDVENSKEWRLVSTLVRDMQQEQVRSRRWGILFKSLTFVFLFSLLFGAWYGVDESTVSQKEHIALVEVYGPIMSGAPASSDQIVASLVAAFEEDAAKAVILDINSPGGSPVQSGIVYDELNRLQSKYPNKPVYAVISDVGASGAYYIAAAADYIYADKASMVGSIGVIGSGFGFTELMQKVGVERRSYTAGNNKDFLDPFQVEKPSQKADFERLLGEVHEQFVDVVKAGRGDRLKDSVEVFSGAVWNGEKAVAMGLIDGLGSIYTVAREQIGIAELELYRPQQTPLQELMDEMGAQASVRLQAWLQTPSLR